MSLRAHRETWVPVALYADLVSDAEPLPVFVTSMSEQGMTLDSPAMNAGLPKQRLQVQLVLPGEAETLWIGAEIVRDHHGLLFDEIGVRFLAMANAHWRALRRWVRVRELVLATRPLGVPRAA
jgi:hypothetical protein